jgi:hypothetical protein
MSLAEKYDKVATGVISGLLLPFLTAVVIFLVSSKGYSLHGYLVMIQVSDIITHSISLCVFPNVVIFMLFNRYDMLRALKGVLGITIVWAVIVFGIKFLT